MGWSSYDEDQEELMDDTYGMWEGEKKHAYKILVWESRRLTPFWRCGQWWEIAVGVCYVGVNWMWPACNKSRVEDFCGVGDECTDFITARSMLDERLWAFLVIPFMIVYISKWYWLQ